MKLAVDLHIHSCLSPCADEHMTPHNIFGMAKLKGLDAIAITDHNHAGNLKSAAAVAGKYGVLLVPGIEVQSREEVHLLCYFHTVADATLFGNLIYDSLPDIKNRPELFGKQTLVDENDQICGEVEKLLLSSSSFSISEICVAVEKQGGVVVPAHVNRQLYSLISTLGFIPKDANFKTLEIYETLSAPGLQEFQLIHSSDAHSLGDILEPDMILTVREKSVSAILETF